MSKTARDKIHELRALHNDGILSQEEFDRRKNAILDAQLAPTNPFESSAATRHHGTELGLAAGQELGPPDKRYRLERQLGQGGMGQVWLATDLATHAEIGHSEKVALKIIPAELTQSTLHAKLLVEETTQARKLAHENIVRVYEWAQDPATTSYFIIMEYLEGTDLDRHLSERGTFSLEQVKQFLLPVAHALRYAWDKHQLVHRDLKPGNLMLTQQGEVKLLDFGIAARVRSAQSASGASSPNGVPANAGTVGYRAPEAGTRQRQPNPRLDVYALAVMIYQMLEGELPFGETRSQQPLPSAPRVLDPQQWEILQRGFAFRPELRPVSALALMEALFPPLLEPSTPPLLPKVPEEVRIQQQRNLAIQEQRKQVQAQRVAEEKRKLEQQTKEQQKQQALARTQALREQVQRLRQEEQKRLAAEAEAQRQEVERRKHEQMLAQQKRLAQAEARLRESQAQVVPQTAGAAFRDPFVQQPGQGPLMVMLPTGRFLMGSPDQERKTALLAGAQASWLKHETPMHWVSITETIAIGKHPVMVGEWREFAQATGWSDEGEFTWDEPGFPQDHHHPVVWISWEDAQKYCRWLSQVTGHVYRLATEAEWEFACRAGRQSAFSWGDHIHPGLANYDANFTYNGGARGDARYGTTRSGSFAPNGWGLYDMHGNVWEWVQDVVHDHYEGAPEDGSAWLTGGNQGHRILRGGSWLYGPRYLRSASRNGFGACGRNDIVGMRVVRVMESAETLALIEADQAGTQATEEPDNDLFVLDSSVGKI